MTWARWAGEEAEDADPLRMFHLTLPGGGSASEALSAVDVVRAEAFLHPSLLGPRALAPCTFRPRAQK
jgi:hypothetical protein